VQAFGRGHPVEHRLPQVVPADDLVRPVGEQRRGHHRRDRREERQARVLVAHQRPLGAGLRVLARRDPQDHRSAPADVDPVGVVVQAAAELDRRPRRGAEGPSAHRRDLLGGDRLLEGVGGAPDRLEVHVVQRRRTPCPAVAKPPPGR